MDLSDTSQYTDTEEAPISWEAPIRIGDVSDAEGSFAPFDRYIRCPECYHEFLLQVSPIHLKVEIGCPRCMAPLSDLIRGHISQRQKRAGKRRPKGANPTRLRQTKSPGGLLAEDMQR